MKTLGAYSKGQIGVIMTLVIAVLLGAVALGADVSVLYYNWVQLQKAADAGVLAGANYLTGDPTTTNESQVISVANSFAQANGLQASEIVNTWTWDNDSKVSMRVSRTVPYFFARLLGLTTGSVATQATAGLNGTVAPGGLIPIGLPCPPTDPNPSCSDLYRPWNPGPPGSGTLYHFKLGPTGTKSIATLGPGNYEALALGSPGGAQYRSNIEFGYSGTVNVGTYVYTETGNLVGPTVQGFDARTSFSIESCLK